MMSSNNQSVEQQVTQEQYSRTKILILWALVTVPMGVFRFLLMPYLVNRVDLHPGILYWWLMIVGMMWQFVLSVIILRKELGKLTFLKLKERLWLNHPIDPESGKVIKRVYWWVIPIILYAALIEQTGFFSFIEEKLILLIPAIESPSFIEIQALMMPEFRGAWYLVGIALVSSVFNYLLGEELFFRGVLLPKMNGAFGKWDWAVNGLLFAGYHIHKIAEIPLFMVGSIFYSFLNKKYRSFYPGLLIHGVEAIPLFLFIILFVSGII